MIDRSELGVTRDRLCKCSNVHRNEDQFVMTKAFCCISDKVSDAAPVQPRVLVTCPPQLPHVTRLRSNENKIRCPAPSQPFKCVCLGGTNNRTRGSILEDTCSCELDTLVTRAVCCSGQDSENDIVIKV